MGSKVTASDADSKARAAPSTEKATSAGPAVAWGSVLKSATTSTVVAHISWPAKPASAKRSVRSVPCRSSTCIRKTSA